MLAADSLGRELCDYLIDHMYGEPPEKRRRCGWVMNHDWYQECREVAAALGGEVLLPEKPQIMFGLPILAVRDDGGVPHLELID